jgi:cation diffusion facilitator CzcD-associated flavoprotein CzcO
VRSAAFGLPLRTLGILQTEHADSHEDREFHQVIVIGAGFSGLNMAIRLRQEGHRDFLVLERAGDIGGTWRDNVYPGCACDVPSLMYSFSFEQNPDWSTAFAGAEEIQRYLQHCARKYAVLDHVRFHATVVRADFDEREGLWTLCIADGRRYAARLVVSAAGKLVDPAWPEIAGRERYAGKLMHTARWDRTCVLAGKRVGVIGTGASAIQVIPALQKEVSSLTVFQRTPAWVVPKSRNRRSARMRRLFKRFPWAQNVLRKLSFALTDALLAPALILDSPLTNVLERMAQKHLRAQIKDPVLRAKLTPSYRLGCKRMLVSSQYYPALEAANIELVTEPIASFTEQGILTRDGRQHELDAVVVATGFRVDTSQSLPFEVRGLAGASLNEVWSHAGAHAYKGMAVAGFPNWMFMLGPNTGPGHTSALVYGEAQADYILSAIAHMAQQNLKYLTVKKAVEQRYSASLHARMRYTTWTSGCASWYLDDRGENHALFPGPAAEFVLSVRRFQGRDYEQVAW